VATQAWGLIALPIGRPRRIFRAGLPKPEIKGFALVLVAVAAVAGGVSLAMLPHRSPVPAAPAETLSAQPAQVAVVDGGTLRLGDRVVRLLGVEPPARGTSCADQDCGVASTNALAVMVREAPVVCRITGMDSTGRPYGICRAGGTELNRSVILAGWARAGTTEPKLQRAEQAARSERRGIWAPSRE
jgi:endonuclease YncB( thermonuclease family)